MNLAEVIRSLKQADGIHIDVGYRQGDAAVLRQLQRRSGRNETKHLQAYVGEMKSGIEELERRAQPYHLPADYIEFLETYGGLYCENQAAHCHLMVNGLGPMVLDWYNAVDGDGIIANPGEASFLSLGTLVFRVQHQLAGDRVEFYSDLAGHFVKNGVIGVGPSDNTIEQDLRLLHSPIHDASAVRVVGTSFTDWLVEIAKTRGSLGYG